MSKQKGRDHATQWGTRFTFVGFNESGDYMFQENYPFPDLPLYRSSKDYCAGYAAYAFHPSELDDGSALIMLGLEVTR